MLTLTHKLPTEIIVNGITYDVDMSFDNIILLNEMLSDVELDDATQITTGLLMLFGEIPNLPPNELVDLFNRTYIELVGVAEDTTQYDRLGNPLPVQSSEDNERCYDLKQDAEYIYASFFQDYRIDLIEEQGKMHWYKFKALLAGLSDTTKFKKVIEIRTMPIPTGKGSGKQAEEVKKVKKAYALKGVEE